MKFQIAFLIVLMPVVLLSQTDENCFSCKLEKALKEVDSIKIVLQNRQEEIETLKMAIDAMENKTIPAIIAQEGKSFIEAAALVELSFYSTPQRAPNSLISKIPSSAKLYVFSYLENNNTYEVYYNRQHGYVPASQVEANELLVALKKAQSATSPKTNTNQSSTSPIKTSSYSSGSNCPSVQCTGRTKKGDRCKNRTTNCNGRCHTH
jgi:hypothetical protein